MTSIEHILKAKLEWQGQLPDVLDVVEDDIYQMNNESDDAKLATLFSATGGNFSVIHIDYVDFVPELGWQFGVAIYR